jgi:dCTP diphosphatase
VEDAAELNASAGSRRDLAELAARMRAFTEERDWGRFHDPKSLVLALVGEVGELAELLQWVPADEVVTHFEAPEKRERVGEELSDVLLYLVRLADVLGVDLTQAAEAKLAAAATRFPADSVRGAAPLKE